MSRPGFEPPTSCAVSRHFSKELFEQLTLLLFGGSAVRIIRRHFFFKLLLAGVRGTSIVAPSLVDKIYPIEKIKNKMADVFLARSGKHFGSILNFLRDGSVPLPDTRRELKELLVRTVIIIGWISLFNVLDCLSKNFTVVVADELMS
jgi:hypothetical protein